MNMSKHPEHLYQMDLLYSLLIMMDCARRYCFAVILRV